MRNRPLREAPRYRGRPDYVLLAGLALLALAILAAGTRSALRQRLNVALLQAAEADDAKRVALLLRRGADPRAPVTSCRGWFMEDCRSSVSPLSAAAASGSTKSLRAMLDSGAPADGPDANGDRPLATAATSSRLEVVRLLLERGAHVDARSAAGQTALMSASVSPDVVRLLLAHGADPRARDSANVTPLAYAASNNSQGAYPSAVLLLRAGADPNAPDSTGRTPLSYACRYGQAATAKLLLRSGANPNACDKDGSTVLMDAAGGGSQAIVSELLRRGAQVDARDKAGHTALWLAASCGNVPVVKTLAARGADPDATVTVRIASVDGHVRLQRQVPIVLAVARSDWATVRALLNVGARTRGVTDDSGTPIGKLAATYRAPQSILRDLNEPGAMAKQPAGR